MIEIYTHTRLVVYMHSAVTKKLSKKLLEQKIQL
jgi:hypothetical protein